MKTYAIKKNPRTDKLLKSILVIFMLSLITLISSCCFNPFYHRHGEHGHGEHGHGEHGFGEHR